MGAVSIPASGEWYDDGPVGDQPPAKPSLAGAVSASLLLHGVVLAGLANVTFLAGHADNPSDNRHAQSISITLVAPDRESFTPEAAEQMPSIPTATNTEEDVAKPAPGQEVAPRSRSVVETPVSEGQPSAEPATEARFEPDRAATLAMVSAGIAGYIESRRGETTRAYVEDCIRYRNRHGPATQCPEAFDQDPRANGPGRRIAEEVFATVTREADHARMRDKLERENDFLKDLLEAGGPLGEQAEIRWRLNRQYHAYLSGNMLPELAFRAQTAFGNGYGRTITPAPYQFSCGIMAACVYEFTGFTVKRPANYVEKEPSFAERTPLFMPSKD